MSISDSGLLINRKNNPYGKDYELIIVPGQLARGLISALHLNPPKSQFKKVWNRHFFALESEKLIEDCTQSCALCTALQPIPRELFEQGTHEIPPAVGKLFSADIIRREGQKIFVLVDVFSSFMVAKLIANEQSITLQEAIIQLSANYKHLEGCTIRVDHATGFVALRNDKFLNSINIKLEFGRIKNKNQNPCIEKAIDTFRIPFTQF